MVLKSLRNSLLRRSNKNPATKFVDTTLRNTDASSTSSSSKGSAPEGFTSQLAAEVETLCQKNKFTKAIKLVAQSSIGDWIELNGDDPLQQQKWPLNKSTPLHMILRHNQIKLQQVEELIQIMYEQFHVLVPEEFPDSEGLTPVHHAVAVGCTEDIVKRLLSGESLYMPAVWRDYKFQRTALHWACQPITGLKGRKLSMAQFNQKYAAFVLMDEYPEAVELRDSFGKTPLDYAHEHKLGAIPNMERKLKFLSSLGEKPAASEEPNTCNFDLQVSGVGLPDDLSTIVDVLDLIEECSSSSDP